MFSSGGLRILSRTPKVPDIRTINTIEVNVRDKITFLAFPLSSGILSIVGASAGSSELFPVSRFLIIRVRKIPKTIAPTIIDKIINVLNKP